MNDANSEIVVEEKNKNPESRGEKAYRIFAITMGIAAHVALALVVLAFMIAAASGKGSSE